MIRRGFALACVVGSLDLACAGSAPSSTAPHAPAASSEVAAPPTASSQAAPPPAEPSASVSSSSGPTDAATGEVVLTTYFEAVRTDGRRHPLVSGESLKSGDRFSMQLSVREPLYLYVLY